MAKKELDWRLKNAKRNMPISLKMLGMMVGIVVVGTVCAMVMTLLIFDSGILGDTEKSLDYTAVGVSTTFADWQTTLGSYTALLSQDAALQQGTAERDTERLKKILDAADKGVSVGFIALTDVNGVVISGTNIKAGTVISPYYAVNSALNGKPAAAFDSIGSFAYALYASHPVYYGGNIVGSLTMGVDLVSDSSSSTVDMVKNSYNVECTILKGDVRLASTMPNMVGVHVSNRDVVNTVIRDGGQFKGYTNIEGKRYYAIYWPLSSGPAVTGMCFVAKSLETMEAVSKRSMKIVIPSVSGLVLVLVLLAFRFVRWLMWRISNVTNFLKELESGDADLTKRSKLFIRDEIGDLIIHFNFFLEKLHEIISTLKDSKSRLYDSGMKMLQSSDETVDAIRMVNHTIEGVSSQIAAQSGSVEQTAGAVRDISGNITELDHMIEGQASGVTQASAAVEEMIGNIRSVNVSVDKMAASFESLSENAQTGFAKQQDVNARIKQIENQSQMLQEANQAISSIAEQTNLLAMNAAIEAAHAGEAGKGFSVVADEIRKLSETSGAQSKTIGEQLNNIRESISEVVSASMDSSEAFTAVSNKIKETDQLVMQIKSAMEEQNSGSRQISDALKAMNDSTVEVRRSSKEMSGMNERISKEMNSLQDVTANMRQGMDEMSGGARRITESSASLGGIAKEVRASIDQIGKQIDLFKV